MAKRSNLRSRLALRQGDGEKIRHQRPSVSGPGRLVGSGSSAREESRQDDHEYYEVAEQVEEHIQVKQRR